VQEHLIVWLVMLGCIAVLYACRKYPSSSATSAMALAVDRQPIHFLLLARFELPVVRETRMGTQLASGLRRSQPQ
jgi:hypothetical protein